VVGIFFSFFSFLYTYENSIQILTNYNTLSSTSLKCLVVRGTITKKYIILSFPQSKEDFSHEC